MVETTKSIWLDDKQAPATDIVDAMQFTRLTDFIGTECSTPGAPEVFFVLSTNESLEVQPPNDIIGMHEIERRKRNGHRGRPSVLSDTSFRGPDSVPTRVAVLGVASLFVGNHSVSLRAERVDLKYISIAAIVLRVDDDFKIVIQLLRHVATELGSDGAIC